MGVLVLATKYEKITNITHNERIFLVVLFSQQSQVLKISITAVMEAVIVMEERVETLAEIKRTKTMPKSIAGILAFFKMFGTI